MLIKSTSTYLLAILCAMMVTPAQAVSQRAYVASYGNDLNTATDCYITAPCRTFAQAVTVVFEDGEVLALDSTGYGPVTLSKSISLTAAPGVYAGMSVFPGVTGIIINNPATNVVLRGLTINGQGGDNGIVMNAGGNLSLENCVIANFTGAGVLINAAASVQMVDNLIRNNNVGIQLQAGATTDISGSKFLGNGTGIFATNTTNTITAANISDTLVTGGVNGIVASSTLQLSKINVIRTTVTDNVTVGIKSSAVSPAIAQVFVSDSMVTGNGVGLSQATNGTLKSLGNNTVVNNSPDTSGVIGSEPLK